MFKKLSLVIPVYNESKTLESLLRKVLTMDFGLQTEVIAINDGSVDNSQQIIDRLAQEFPQLKPLTNPQNRGKTQSVKTALLATTGDLVVIQDADLEYDPSDLKLFIEKFQTGKFDVIYGNRFGKNNTVIYWQNWVGNVALSIFSSIFTWIRGGIWTTDMEVCYKMARGDVFRDIAATIVSKSTFGLEPELTAKFAKYRINNQRLRFTQIPINYHPRSIAEGKKMHAWKDGLKALKEILQFNI